MFWISYYVRLTEGTQRVSTVDLRVDYLRPAPFEDLFFDGNCDSEIISKPTISTLILYSPLLYTYVKILFLLPAWQAMIFFY